MFPELTPAQIAEVVFAIQEFIARQAGVQADESGGQPCTAA